jgi:IS30 family transposase
MKTSNHLCSAERDKITILQEEGLSIRTIAKDLYSKSNGYRFVRRIGKSSYGIWAL